MGMMINRRRACGGKKGLLPSGYTQVEYIESTGTQYINTGIYPDNTTDIEYCAVQTGSMVYDNAQTFFGVSDGNYDQNAFTVSTYKYGSYGYGSSRDAGWAVFRVIIGEINVFKLNKYGFYKNGILIKSNSNYTKTTQSKTLKFFAAHYNTLVEFGRHQVLWSKIWNDDILVRDFIPCKNPNNVVGMYDTVGKQFYSSPNGVAFIAGPEV